MQDTTATVRYRIRQDGQGSNVDERGLSVSLASRIDDFLGRTRDTHVTTIRPGLVRGNHYHKVRREVLIVMHKGAFTLSWQDGGPGGPDRTCGFTGEGVVLIELEPPCPHALRNDAQCDLWVVAHCDSPHSPADPDTFPHKLI